MIFSVVDKIVKLFAIPYDPKTGCVFDRIYEGKFIDIIKEQFMVVTGMMSKDQMKFNEK